MNGLFNSIKTAYELERIFTIKLSLKDSRIRVLHDNNYLGTEYSEGIAANISDDAATRIGLDLLQQEGRADMVEKYLSSSAEIKILRTELVGEHDILQARSLAGLAKKNQEEDV